MRNSNSTALAYFAFARPWHTKESLASLASNYGSFEIPLYMFSDAGRNEGEWDRVAAVREVLRGAEGFRDLHLTLRKNNLGCAANIIDGVSRVLRDHESVIVVEDDLQLSPYFLEFMKRALETYADRADIISISGGCPSMVQLGLSIDDVGDVYLAPRSSPWGWATWRDRWAGVDWELPRYPSQRWQPEWRRRMARGGSDLLFMLDDQMAGKIDSWNVRFNHSQAMAGSYSLYPKYSYVRNVGLDGSGRHCRASDRHEVELGQALAKSLMPPDIQPEEHLMRAVKGYHDEHLLSLLLGTIPGVRSLTRATKKRLGVDRPLLKRRD